MNSKSLLMLLLLLATFIPSIATTQTQSATFQDRSEHIEKQFQQQMDALEKQWLDYEQEENRRMTLLEQNVLKKWQQFERSSKTIWVDYNANADSYSKVDFHAGTVKIQASLPAGADASQQRQVLGEKLLELLRARDLAGQRVMDDNLDSKSLKKFQRNESKMEKSAPFAAADGQKRIVVSVHLDMVPEHLSRRAKRYLPFVKKYAEEYQVDAALIMAIIHTESAFNPMARSHIPAYGLMQLVPRWGAREAYAAISGQDRILRADFLYHPKNNIQLGTKYVSLLHTKYFSGYPTDKQRLLSSSAYNWGPGSVKKHITDKNDIHKMSASSLQKLIQRKAPKETRDYVRNIEKRRKLYMSKV